MLLVAAEHVERPHLEIVELVGEHGPAAAGPVRDYVSGLARAIRAGQKENAA